MWTRNEMKLELFFYTVKSNASTPFEILRGWILFTAKKPQTNPLTSHFYQIIPRSHISVFPCFKTFTELSFSQICFMKIGEN